MSANDSLRSCLPLKTVFGKIGDTYQASCHTYKTHAMATHHGGSGQHSDRGINAHKTTDAETEHAQEFHHINTSDFQDSEPNNPTRLTAITRKLDDLCQQVQAGGGQPSNTLNCIKHELQKLSISLHPWPPPKPLEEVLKHYMILYVLLKSRQTLQHYCYKTFWYLLPHTYNILIERPRDLISQIMPQ